jgi:hypothetical protein
MLSSDGSSQPLLLRKQKNSKQQGDVGLAIAIAWFAKNGYRVAIPLTDSQDYDLIIDSEGSLYKVQVRTTYFKNPQGWYRANLKVSGGNRSGTGKVKLFDPHRVHYLFVVTDTEAMYFIPCSAIDNNSSITLCEKYEQYRVR